MSVSSATMAVEDDPLISYADVSLLMWDRSVMIFPWYVNKVGEKNNAEP